jgi:hypothetical protein
MRKTTLIGGTVDLRTPPTAVNAELHPDCHGDDQDTLDEKRDQRNVWTRGSITNDGKIVIPIDRKTKKRCNESIRACGRPFHCNASTVPIAGSFPIELGFCITVPKCQGRTVHKLIASLSEHPTNFLKLGWEQLCTILSCMTERDAPRLLSHMGNRNTRQCMSALEKDPCTTRHFAGFPKEPANEVAHWDPTLAAKAA